ncbi:MAG: sigma-70 family RNA polymerase sigma factor [Vicinamibacterales bacterium]
MTGASAVAPPSASSPNPSCRNEGTVEPCDDGLPAFLAVRTRLFSIAYRLLGDAAEAEDVVQDAWLRWQTADRCAVRNPQAFLTTTATRLAINVVRSARARHETAPGPGQPEPADTRTDPWLATERDQALTLGIRMLLEKLTPTERAAYILREAFGYAYRDIARVLRLAEANARQVVTRARQHLASTRTMAASAGEHERLLGAFITAAHDGNVAVLEDVLASHAAWAAGDVVRAA